MSEIQSLPGALRRQAAADPESPFLFWPDGWNWRWWSWRETAELAARWAAPLAGLPPACSVAFADAAYPEAIALDLAVQSAGLTPVPLLLGRVGGGALGRGRHGRHRQEVQGAEPAPAAAEQAGCLAWLDVVGGEVRVTRLEAPIGGAAPAAVPTGDPGVLVTGEAGSWRRLSQSEVLTAAAEVERAIVSRSGPAVDSLADSQEREILVAGWPLQEWAGRLLAAWAVAAGAALVLEADPALRLGAVLWARPTVFHGTAEELAALRLRVKTARRLRRWRRRQVPPLGRLRTLFQSAPPAADDAAFWRQRGVRLLRLPGLGGDASLRQFDGDSAGR